MKKVIFLFIVSFTTFSCNKEEFSVVNLNGNRITALGHGGMGIGNTYPMDSFESISKCLNLGMDGSEMDVQMTDDSVLVAFHDIDLSGSTTLEGLINSKSWNELKSTHYNQTPYLEYAIISLDQLFSHVENLHKYKFTFDCKLYTNHSDSIQFYKTYINAMVVIIAKYHLENNIYIESQDERFLQIFKNRNSDYKLFIYPSSFESGLEIALAEKLTGITISTRNITGDQIKIAHDNGLMVAIWNTLSESDNIEAIRKNPDFIQTDEVKNLLKLLK